MPFVLISLVISIVCSLLILAIIIFFVVQILSIFTTVAPFVPLPTDVVEEVVRRMKLDSGSVLYDLGCGNGKILIEASEEHPDIKAVGIEVAFWPYWLAKFNTRKFPNIRIRRESFFTTDLKDATHIFMYLWPGVIDKLMPIFQKQCGPGTKIFSCDFEAKNYQPTEVLSLTGKTLRGKKLFVYVL